MSAAMGPFAVDEGLVKVAGNEAVVRIYNTNTKKIIHARFPMDEGKAAVDGDLEIPGVAGVGAPIRLEFREPGGATTGKLLPTGNVVDTLDVPGVGKIRASLIDAANASCFLHAADLGLTGIEMPEALDAAKELLEKLAKIRIAASIAMGIGRDAADAARRHSVPFIGFVSPAQDAPSLAGAAIAGANVHLTARMLSNGQPHRALPLTVSLCLAVAARIKGSIVNEVARLDPNPDAGIKIALPSGVLTVAAIVNQVNGAWHAELGGFYRTARRLFDGHVHVSAARVPQFVPKSRDKARAAA
jgi:2-methylaconitate cis-trans-isomerase PrpF